MLEKSPCLDNSRNRQILRRAPLFAGADNEQLGQILHFSRRVALGKNDLLFRKGEPCGAFYCLVDGLINLQVTGPGGHEKTVEFVEPGQTFAEDALFSGHGYPVSARALSDSTLIAIQGFTFTRFLQKHPSLSWQVMAALSNRLYQRERQIESLSLCAAEQRVAAYLLQYSDAEETPECCAVQHIPPRRKELASILGITVETLCRILGSLKKRSLINVEDTHITVLDHRRLQDLLQYEA